MHYDGLAFRETVAINGATCARLIRLLLRYNSHHLVLDTLLCTVVVWV